MESHYHGVNGNREFETLKIEITFDLVKKLSTISSILKALDNGCGMEHTSLLWSDLAPQIVNSDA